MKVLSRCGALLLCATFVAPMLEAADAPTAERLKQGATALQQGRYGEALSLFDAVLAAEPANVEALIGRGQALSRTGRGPEARDAYQQALGIEPDSRPARLALAWLDLWSDTPSALESLRELRAGQPDDVQLSWLDKAARRQIGPRVSLGFGAAEDNQDLQRNGLQLEAATGLRNGNQIGFRATHARAEYEDRDDDVNVTSFEANATIAAGAGRRLELHAGLDQIEDLRGESESKPSGGLTFRFGLGRAVGGAVSVARENLTYGPVQIEDGIEANRLDARFDAEFGPQLLAEAVLARWQVTSDSGDIDRTELSANLGKRFQLGRGVPLVVGYSFQYLDHDRDFRNGFWAPKDYVRHAGFVRTSAWLSSGFGFQLSAEIGSSSYEDQGGRALVKIDGQSGLRLFALASVPLGRESGLRLEATAQRLDSGLDSVAGYASNSFGVRLAWRGTRSLD